MALTGSVSILLRCAVLTALVLAVGACQTPVTLPHEPAPRAAVPVSAPLPPLPVEGSRRFVVDSSRSDVRILVYREGPLARVGHNHVLRVHDLRGDIYLAQVFHESGFQLTFPVAGLQVDPADARADEDAEFSVMPSSQAIDATYRNMIGPAVLDAQRFPDITLRSLTLTGPAWGPDTMVRVTLHGVARDLIVPLAITHRDEELVVTGAFTLRTSDFGMTPFSALGGGLRVRDEVRVRFHVVARQAL